MLSDWIHKIRHATGRADAKSPHTRLGAPPIVRVVRATPAHDAGLAPRGVWRRPLQLNPVWTARVLVLASMVIAAIVTTYYYNLLVDLEQDVNTAAAQIDRELQRRADLVRSLLPAVFEYADLERQVFTLVAQLRAQKPQPNAPTVPSNTPSTAADGGAQAEMAPKAAAAIENLLGAQDPVGTLLGRFLAVSEQYPDMKSGRPFELLMEKTVEIEDRLATERERYNDRVNEYTTLIASFPGRLFANLFGFEDHSLFAADPKARPAPIVRWPPANAVAQRNRYDASAGAGTDASSLLGQLSPLLDSAPLRMLLEAAPEAEADVSEALSKRLSRGSTAP